MKIRAFNPESLHPAHEGTILAQGVFSSTEIGSPFGCAFGVLKPGMAQKPEAAPVSKLYYVRYGEAIMQINDEKQIIKEGDVVFIPAQAWHTVRNESDKDFSTFAIWWQPKQS